MCVTPPSPFIPLARDPASHRHSRREWLIGYQVNPWTVFYVGSSEGYQVNADSQLVPQQRTFFVKGSYYFQP